jgi:hypothetical protein
MVEERRCNPSREDGMDLRDVQLDKPGELPPDPARRYPWLWVGVAIAVVVAIAAYIMLARRAAPPDRVNVTDVSPAGPAEGARTPRALGGEGEDIDLPPLSDSDPIVRELVRKLSSHPTVVAWLAGDNLLRGFVAATNNIASNRSPASHVQRLAPAAPFAVTERDGATFIDPRSYERYDRLADAVASVDAAGAARLYTTVKPRLNEAQQELGTGAEFDAAFERAIVLLLQTPVPDGPVRLVPTMEGITYAFADPRLEGLAPAQKQLLRMGPRNARRVQAKLGEIARALGI